MKMRPLVLIVMLAAMFAQDAGAGTVVSRPFVGVTCYHTTLTIPRPLNINVVVIDPQTPGIRFAVSPGNGDQPREFNRQTTLDFAQQIGAQVAINTGFFFPWPEPPLEVDVKGLAACEGVIVSPQEDDIVRPVLDIAADNRVRIIDSDAVQEGELYNAASGNERLVIAGRNHGGQRPFNDPKNLNPRTAAGLTADGKLVLITIDGRQEGFSEGMLNSETADLLIEYGVTEALNFDGGGSTTMVLADPEPRVATHPPGGRLRAVANSLAVFAEPADEPGNLFIYSDFYGGDDGPLAVFMQNHGKSQWEVLRDGERWIGRLTVKADHEHAAWQGSCFFQADHPANPLRPLRGVLSVALRTETAGLEAAVEGLIGEEAISLPPQKLMDDGKWQTLTWSLPQIEGQESFRLSGVMFEGSADAVIDMDDLMHDVGQ
ncbi:MAG: phosphodiester glycosidase family protein [Phycisphaeraceae bacterium]|nr:phosphodiester glycosidase family protein [Phycisphaeraceae bacterium]